MAFKHNLPIPAVVAGLLIAALAALYLFSSPPDEDLLRQAIDRHVATLGPVKQREVHGNVADIIAGDSDRLIYAEFEKQNGQWVYARNLAEEFSKAMKDPAVQEGIVRHLGERISQRFQQSVSFGEGLRDFRFDLGRDSTGTLGGTCTVAFAYPKVGDAPQRRGKYVESFEWKDGKWQSIGPGSLYDAVR